MGKPPNPPKKLEPLIPLDDLGKVLQHLAHVKPEAIKKAREEAKAPDYPDGLTPRPNSKAKKPTK